MQRRWGPAVLAVLAVVGCGGAEPAGAAVDAGVIDGAATDGAAVDGAAIDGARMVDAAVDAAVDAVADAAHVFVGAGPFGGAWLCQYSATTSITTPIPQDIMSSGVDFIDVGDGTTRDLEVMVNGPTGPCVLAADRVGDQATFTPGQHCTRTESGVVITFTLVTGHGDATGGTLLLDLAGPISGNLGMATVAGTLTTQYACVHN